jgi:diketogulonate reductase-like aldo/keto reductase
MILQDTFTLKNGIKIPKLGLGTWQIPEGEEAYQSVLWALKHGYRHIDTAMAYGNETSVGRATQDFPGRKSLLRRSCLPSSKDMRLPATVLRSHWQPWVWIISICI